MKVIITGMDQSIEGAFNPRFGRSEYFILVDTDTGTWETFENPGSKAAGGAGPQAVQFIADKGSQAVISGRYGPSAFTALQAAGIKAYIANQETVKGVLEKFQAGELEPIHTPTGPGLHGGEYQ
jgi:predicted Fe-Mo cluster-binding NifX family protein